MKYFGLWLLCGAVYTWLNRKMLKEKVIGVKGITPLLAYFVTTLFWMPLIVDYLIKKIKGYDMK